VVVRPTEATGHAVLSRLKFGLKESAGLGIEPKKLSFTKFMNMNCTFISGSLSPIRMY